jgi:xylulokinase
LKIARERPLAFANTEHVSLVSSFLASILLQKYAPIDSSDASGMNLLDIHTKDWHPDLLRVIGSDLKDKLGSVVNGDTILGKVGPFFVQKFGFPQGIPKNMEKYQLQKIAS